MRCRWVNSGAAQVAAKPYFGPSVRKSTPDEKSARLAICAACPSNHAGICHGSTCCGSRVPVETMVNLNVKRCPQKKWQ